MPGSQQYTDSNAPSLEALGDSALIVRFGDRLDARINAQVHRAAALLAAANLAGVREIVPAYASLTVHYDPAFFSHDDSAQIDVSPFARIGERLLVLLHDSRDEILQTTRLIEIPVCYGAEFGPDLADVAAHAGLSEAEVVALHSTSTYRVAMLGFAPGFPYLFGLNESLHLPRRATPRTRVPAGSVAIGGQQTGIYPGELPGGWHLIGRTPLHLFDAARASPALLAPADEVRFIAIDADEFAHLQTSAT
ncbi:5-oxoprolinase subunit PxpB [Pseudolysobacter antarcticus]|uniref:5-oxoprolinase subunit PxpB n=1 Tax=Pseudolysobacter antarcticus TaxID=2511995 RepID=A0A411HM02_9GAMM|nr:5-oxoprolinase subunit PxpB [Pseudolysobacter antarcticus]QBB71397.1 5-oxoprolinase subunit PxpB [Pseudolysobacter antarcticus]